MTVESVVNFKTVAKLDLHKFMQIDILSILNDTMLFLFSFNIHIEVDGLIKMYHYL